MTLVIDIDAHFEPGGDWLEVYERMGDPIV
jgi:hypothetical protein